LPARTTTRIASSGNSKVVKGHSTESCANDYSQGGEPEPEEGTTIAATDIASLETSRHESNGDALSNAATPRKVPFASPLLPSRSAELNATLTDGSRLQKAQARHSICIEQLKSFAGIIDTLEKENRTLRVEHDRLARTVRDLQGVRELHVQRKSAVAADSDDARSRRHTSGH